MPNIFSRNICINITKPWPRQTAAWPAESSDPRVDKRRFTQCAQLCPQWWKKIRHWNTSVMILLPLFSKQFFSFPQWSPLSRGATPRAPRRRGRTSCSSANPARAPVHSSTAGRRPATASCCPPPPWWVSEPSLVLPIRRESSRWRRSTSPVLTVSAADPVSGIVTVKNASDSASGTYRCVASNRVGAEDCILQLKVTPRTSRSHFTSTLLFHHQVAVHCFEFMTWAHGLVNKHTLRIE